MYRHQTSNQYFLSVTYFISISAFVSFYSIADKHQLK